MGLFDKKSSEEKEALKELESYKKKNYYKFREISPSFGITRMNRAEKNYFNNIINELKNEIKNDGLTSENIYNRIIEIFIRDYGEPLSEDEANHLLNEEKLKPVRDKERQLEKKFGTQFQDKCWFQCTIEEMKYSTFSNTNNRDVDTAYVIIEDDCIEIYKESVFLKSNMGHRKVYYQNIAGIDFDARGKFHASNSLIINLKSSEHVQLKYVKNKWVKIISEKYEQYLSGANNVVAETSENKNDVDDLMKYAELYEKGLLTKEEFDMKKAEIMGTSAKNPESESTLKFCANCGNPIESDTNFCTNCGNPINN